MVTWRQGKRKEGGKGRDRRVGRERRKEKREMGQ